MRRVNGQRMSVGSIVSGPGRSTIVSGGIAQGDAPQSDGPSHGERTRLLYEALRDIDTTAKNLHASYTAASPASRQRVLSGLMPLRSEIIALTQSIDALVANIHSGNRIIGLLSIAVQSQGDAERLLSDIRLHLDSINSAVKQILSTVADSPGGNEPPI